MAHEKRANFKKLGGGNMRAFGQTLDGTDVSLFVDEDGRLKLDQTAEDLLRDILVELKTSNTYLAIIAEENLQET